MNPFNGTRYSMLEFADQALQFGLVSRGGFIVDDSDNVPNLSTGPAASLLLFGNAGSSLWPEFSTSMEYADGKPDPLNRWSERIAIQLAGQWHGKVLLPFGGPPYQPFIGWAKKAENLRSSQLGLLMHPRYGLWHAYRFAVALPYQPEGINPHKEGVHACDSCDHRACLKACPVNAFTVDGYDVETCFRYLHDTPQAVCHSQGCQARMACPEGEEYRYIPEHAAFHMQKFIESLTHRFD